MLLTSQYAITKVYCGYRDLRDALVTFGHEVRREAAAQHWRYEVVTSHDGGMLLYLEKTHFIEPDQAVAEWNSGDVDALVVREVDATILLARLAGATASSLRSDQKKVGRGKSIY